MLAHTHTHSPYYSYPYSKQISVKLSLSASELLSQLQTVTRVASTRSAVQALSGVMVSAAADSTPELLATDMEVGLRVPLVAEVVRPGFAVLPARLLLDVARSLPAEELTMELRSSEQDVELICGPATFHLRTLRAEDFPTLPAPDRGDAHHAPAGGLRGDRRRACSARRPETRRAPCSPAS